MRNFYPIVSDFRLGRKAPQLLPGLLALAFSENPEGKAAYQRVRASNTSPSSYHYKLNSLGLAELTGIIKPVKKK